jgi:hypothetical protein
MPSWKPVFQGSFQENLAVDRVIIMTTNPTSVERHPDRLGIPFSSRSTLLSLAGILALKAVFFPFRNVPLQPKEPAVAGRVSYQSVSVDGLSIFYREAGPNEAATRTSNDTIQTFGRTSTGFSARQGRRASKATCSTTTGRTSPLIRSGRTGCKRRSLGYWSSGASTIPPSTSASRSATATTRQERRSTCSMRATSR